MRLGWGAGLVRVFLAGAGLAGVSLAGCAPRPVTPVAMSQPGDDALSCAEIAAQTATNRDRAAGLLGLDRQVAQGNVVRGVAMAIPFGGLAAGASMDLSNAEQVQARALLDRNQRLDMLARDKGCPAP